MIRALAALFLFSSILTFAVLVSGPGCIGVCRNNFDCGDQAYCGGDERCHTDCFDDADCREGGLGFRCKVASGRCAGPPVGGPPEGAPPLPPIDDNWDGFNAPVNTGETFIMRSLAIGDPGSGLDVDDICTDESNCRDNSLGLAGEYMNPAITRGVASGDTLIIVEIAGIEETAEEWDDVTVKIYGAYDADVPPRPINNFQKPPGESSCCEFRLDSASVLNNQATARIRARIERGSIRSIERNNASFTLAIGPTPHPVIHLARAVLSGRYTKDGIRAGILGGAVPMSDLAQSAADRICVPGECGMGTAPDRTVLDLVSALITAPDVDLDNDGLECALRISGNPTIDACCDGVLGSNCLTTGGMCAGMIVPPTKPDRTASCAEDSRIRDGYSVALQFDTVPATVVGVQ